MEQTDAGVCSGRLLLGLSHHADPRRTSRSEVRRQESPRILSASRVHCHPTLCRRSQGQPLPSHLSPDHHWTRPGRISSLHDLYATETRDITVGYTTTPRDFYSSITCFAVVQARANGHKSDNLECYSI